MYRTVSVALSLVGRSTPWEDTESKPGDGTASKRQNSVASTAWALDGPTLKRENDGAVSKRNEGTSDAEALIRSLAVVLDTPGAPTLEPAFRRDWRERAVEIREDGTRLEELSRALGLDADRLVLKVAPDGLVARYDRTRVGRWPSAAALLADLSASAILSDAEPRWRSLSGEKRRLALRSLRLFARRCPNCDGALGGVREPASTGSRLEGSRRVECERCGSILFREPSLPAENASVSETTRWSNPGDHGPPSESEC
ncbi:hypothetical protein AB7C87_20020 [Natrarchaeobius sp. A-rgal3]|uniref:hypothetical protein n=1 Tax=Natrarchaeobius versutus TaxID=1679078 RepID=UPI00351051A8